MAVPVVTQSGGMAVPVVTQSGGRAVPVVKLFRATPQSCSSRTGGGRGGRGRWEQACQPERRVCLWVCVVRNEPWNWNCRQ